MVSNAMRICVTLLLVSYGERVGDDADDAVALTVNAEAARLEVFTTDPQERGQKFSPLNQVNRGRSVDQQKEDMRKGAKKSADYHLWQPAVELAKDMAPHSTKKMVWQVLGLQRSTEDGQLKTGGEIDFFNKANANDAHFCSTSAYIIYNVVKQGEDDPLQQDVYYWLGKELGGENASCVAAIEKRFIAAYKTVELTALFDTHVTHHRELDGDESDAFKKVFHGSIVIEGDQEKCGSIGGGFHHVNSSVFATQFYTVTVNKNRKRCRKKHGKHCGYPVKEHLVKEMMACTGGKCDDPHFACEECENNNAGGTDHTFAHFQNVVKATLEAPKAKDKVLYIYASSERNQVLKYYGKAFPNKYKYLANQEAHEIATKVQKHLPIRQTDEVTFDKSKSAHETSLATHVSEVEDKTEFIDLLAN